MEVLEKRVINLEEILADYIKSTTEGHRRVEKELDIMSKNMTQLIQENIKAKNDTAEFKIEMKDFKNEMSDFKTEMRQDTKNMKKQWGELANKMGTLIEDLILPAARPVLQKYFEEEIIFLGSKINKKDIALNLHGEFDVVATSATRVFLIEVKSTPTSEYLDKLPRQLEKLLKLFPEYANLSPVLIMASISIDTRTLNLATKKGIYAMAYREWEYMDIINFNEINP